MDVLRRAGYGSSFVFVVLLKHYPLTDKGISTEFFVNHRESTLSMAEGGSVYQVVDSDATQPPAKAETRPNQGRRSTTGRAHALLVSLMLCSMVVAACLIYRLYKAESGTSATSSSLTAGEDVTSPTERQHDFFPSKPVAHLTDGPDVVHGHQVMAWSMIANPLLYEMEYKNGSLVIEKEGYYYVYSKVSFSDSGTFHHSVELKAKLYSGKCITLLKSRRYAQKSEKIRQSNSYLGGVFHLQKGDEVFVKVSDISKILRYLSFENVFGAYMI